MAEFRRILEQLGHVEVSTLLNSGNAVFQARSKSPERIAADLHDRLRDQLDLDVPVIVKSQGDLAKIIAECPFTIDPQDYSRTLVAFTQSAAALASLRAIGEQAAGRDRFVVGKRAVYLSCPDGILKSKTAEALLGKPGRAATTRNWGTTLKLLQLVSKSEGKSE
jgi:uncharacterized protein (DUF1697 family)